MRNAFRRTFGLAVVLGALSALLAVAPASAAVTGTLCGQVTAFTAPTAATDGSVTIDGTAEVIDSSAFAAVDAATWLTLTALADADATTCLEITADGDGAIVDVEIAASAEICGAVTLDTVTGDYAVGGVALPAGVVSADADLQAALDAALAADADLCATLTVDGTSGLIVDVSVDATIDVCGDVTLDADSATIGGVDVPLSLLDAEAAAALAIAVDAGADVCVEVVIVDTSLVEANVTASIDLCGEVTLDASGNATVDGVVIDAALLDAGAAALLELAATADGTACVAVDASSSNGDTSIGITVTVDVCAEVTAITDGTITLEGIELVWAGAADAGIEIGDVVCIAAGTSPTGDPIVVDSDVAPGSEETGGGGPVLPDTRVPAAGDAAPWAVVMIVAAGIAASRRVRESLVG